jgi:hypothetical protein
MSGCKGNIIVRNTPNILRMQRIFVDSENKPLGKEKHSVCERGEISLSAFIGEQAAAAARERKTSRPKLKNIAGAKFATDNNFCLQQRS